MTRYPSALQYRIKEAQQMLILIAIHEHRLHGITCLLECLACLCSRVVKLACLQAVRQRFVNACVMPSWSVKNVTIPVQ